MKTRLYRALLATLGLYSILGMRAACVLAPPSRSAEVRVGFHVHSTRSDGLADLGAIAHAARAAGLDAVVLTDHNVRVAEAAGFHDGVLFIVGTEESSSDGHVISLGAPRALTDDEKKGDALAAIRALGGAPVLAHPMNRKRPFDGGDRALEAAGFEALSADDLWREALHAPFTRGLVEGALLYPFAPRLGILQLVRRPDVALARFDALQRSARPALFCAVDAHGIPDYAHVFESISMHLPGFTRPLQPEDAARLQQALLKGEATCALDALGDTAGFSLARDASGAAVATQPASGQGELRIYRDGVLLKSTREARITIENTGPGVLRAEVWRPLPGLLWDGPEVPWAISNPMR